METMLILAGLGYGTYWLGTKIVDRIHTAAAQRQFADQQRAAQERQRAEVNFKKREKLRRWNQLYRALQLALINVHHAPDFRRAASLAAQAEEVPLSLRQRQYRRFRPKLLAHLLRRLRNGGDAAALTESLGELLEHLGVASFEAEYMRMEAERRLTPPRTAPPPPNYQQRIEHIQQEHEQRMNAIRQVALQDETMRERLLEAEEERFRHQLLELNQPGGL